MNDLVAAQPRQLVRLRHRPTYSRFWAEGVVAFGPVRLQYLLTVELSGTELDMSLQARAEVGAFRRTLSFAVSISHRTDRSDPRFVIVEPDVPTFSAGLLEHIRPFEELKIVERVGRVESGHLTAIVPMDFSYVVRKLSADWARFVDEFSAAQWEEIVAAGALQEGFDRVVLTPRSGDFGRDVIAFKDGFPRSKVIFSVKAHRRGNIVEYDSVRALMGVLTADPSATSGVLATTTAFPSRIRYDPFIASMLPSRLELLDGPSMMKWLKRTYRP